MMVLLPHEGKTVMIHRHLSSRNEGEHQAMMQELDSRCPSSTPTPKKNLLRY
jgi:hypothetical protein